MENAGTPIDLLGYAGLAAGLLARLALLRWGASPLAWGLLLAGDVIWVAWSWLVGYPSALVNEVAISLVDAHGLVRAYRRARRRAPE